MLTDHLLKVRDTSMFGEVLFEMDLVFKGKTVSVAQLIETRVRKECALRAQGAIEKLPIHNIFDLDEKEIKLNELLEKQEKARNDIAGKLTETYLQQHVTTALKGFDSNQYFVVIDDQQVESLEQTVIIEPSTKVSFMRLQALVGG